MGVQAPSQESMRASKAELWPSESGLLRTLNRLYIVRMTFRECCFASELVSCPLDDRLVFLGGAAESLRPAVAQETQEYIR